MTIPRIFIVGYPKDIGGASTEIWHTAKLFRSRGLQVTMLPTWEPTEPWQERLAGIGVETHLDFIPDKWTPHVDLPGSVVIAFCNTQFIEEVERFQQLRCKIVYLPCMNWLFPQEKLRYRNATVFDRYVFQSHHQRDHVVPQLRKFGFQDEHGTVIRGAFDVDEFPLRPKAHARGERFIIGRLSRPGVDKFPRDLWAQFGRIPYPTSVRVMGWDGAIDDKCGQPPVWGETLPPSAESTQDFLASIHALVPGVDCCVENWPRVGLEAMAAGVPVVAERKGGWVEMLADGGGILVDNAEHQAYEVARLAYDRQHRMGMIAGGRSRVEYLADPDVIWEAWKTLLEGLT